MQRKSITFIHGPERSGKSTYLSLLQRRTPQLDPRRAVNQEDLDSQLTGITHANTVFICEGFVPVLPPQTEERFSSTTFFIAALNRTEP